MSIPFPEPSPMGWESPSGIPVVLIPTVPTAGLQGAELDAANTCHYSIHELGCESHSIEPMMADPDTITDDVLGFIGLATANVWAFCPLDRDVPIHVHSDSSDAQMSDAVEALIFHILIGKDDEEG